MKPNQFVAIKNEVIVKIIIFFDDLNNVNKSLISLKKISDKKRTKKDQKMKFFNFELEEKLDHHFKVKFDGESDGDSLGALNPYFDPLIGPY